MLAVVSYLQKAEKYLTILTVKIDMCGSVATQVNKTITRDNANCIMVMFTNHLITDHFLVYTQMLNICLTTDILNEFYW